MDDDASSRLVGASEARTFLGARHPRAQALTPPPQPMRTSGTSCLSASWPTRTAPHACPSSVRRGYRSGSSRAVSLRGTTCTRSYVWRLASPLDTPDAELPCACVCAWHASAPLRASRPACICAARHLIRPVAGLRRSCGVQTPAAGHRCHRTARTAATPQPQAPPRTCSCPAAADRSTLKRRCASATSAATSTPSRA